MLVVTVQAQVRLSVLEDVLLQALPDDLILNQLVHIFHAENDLTWVRVPRNLLDVVCLHCLSVLGGDGDDVDIGCFGGSLRLLNVLDRFLGLAIEMQPSEISSLSNVFPLSA